MGGKPIAPVEAEASLRTQGFEPLVPYPGAGKPWLARCERCKTEGNRYWSRNARVGCGVCSGNVPIPAERAHSVLSEQGLEPLEPYPGRGTAPWRARCKKCEREVAPRVSTLLRSSVGCEHCARRTRRIDDDAAVALMRAAGWEPQVPYPGSSTPWSCLCTVCDRVRTPSYASVKRGVGCGGCLEKARVQADDAVAMMLAAGARPLEPYLNETEPWECECLTCFKVISPRFMGIKRGVKPCAHCAGNARFEDDEAAAMMRAAGYEPLAPYPGASKPWKSLCAGCETVRQPTLNSLRSKGARCQTCWTRSNLLPEGVVVEVMRTAGFEPLEPYTRSDAPWLCRCLGCEAEASPTYTMVRLGKAGCMACRVSLSLPGRSAGLYVMVHEEFRAVKVGIGVLRHDLFPRVRAHEQRGWVEVTRWVGFDDVRVVAGVERLVLQRWRDEGLSGFVERSLMPQGGWSETAPLALVNVEDLVGMVTVALGDVAASLPAADSVESEGLWVVDEVEVA